MSQHLEDKGDILQQMMIKNPNESVKTMFEFCSEFNLNVNVEIIALIQSLILNWNPELAYETSQLESQGILRNYIISNFTWQ
jgi:hypothetical protein